MNFLVGLLLVLALVFAPAPAPSDSGATGQLVIQTGTEGTQIGWQVDTGGNPRIIIGGGQEILSE